jgi:hypothetical protein
MASASGNAARFVSELSQAVRSSATLSGGYDAGTELEGYEAGWHSQHLERLRNIVHGDP